MGPAITPVTTSPTLPAATTVVVIGGGIVGLMAALTLAERGIPVTVIEKGRIAGEQSSRNLGWVRKTSRGPRDVPLAAESDRLWARMHERVGADVGYRRAGILYAARTEAEMAPHETWLESVRDLSLDSRLLSARRSTRWRRGHGSLGRRHLHAVGRPGRTDARRQRDRDGGAGQGCIDRGELRGPHPVTGRRQGGGRRDGAW